MDMIQVGKGARETIKVDVEVYAGAVAVGCTSDIAANGGLVAIGEDGGVGHAFGVVLYDGGGAGEGGGEGEGGGD